MITSKDNPSIKRLISLKKENRRKKSGLVLIEGKKEASMAKSARLDIQEIFYVPEQIDDKFLRGLGQVKTCSVSRSIFSKVSFRQNPDGIMVVAREPKVGLGDIGLSPNPLVVVLDSLEKPGNLGAVARTAEAAGADAVIVCGREADIYNPNVIRASRGAVFSISVAQAASVEVQAWLKERGICPVVATPHADRIYTDEDLSGPVAVVMGSEDKGVGRIWQEGEIRSVKIPILGRIDSLNVSVSAAILVYEALRQRSGKV